MQLFDKQTEYDTMDEWEKREYLALVERTKITVRTAIEQALVHPDIRTGALILRENISSLISDIMNYIASHDAVGFSMNAGTDLRHTLIWLSKALSAIEFIFSKGSWFNTDDVTGRIEGMREYSPLEQEQISRDLLEKKLKKLST